MPEPMPDDFRSEEELAEWFESADLSEDLLERATDVQIASSVTLVFEQDDNLSGGAATSAPSGTVRLTTA